MPSKLATPHRPSESTTAHSRRGPSSAVLGVLWAVMAPLLLWQGWWVRRRSLVLPEAAGARLGIVGSGPVRLRLLIVGDSSAAGVGAAHQDEALAARLAQALVRLGQGAVAWQLEARSGATVWSAMEQIAAADLRRADMLVTVFGVNESIQRHLAGEYLAGLDALVAQAHTRAGVRRVVHCAPPLMGLMPALPQPLRWMLGGQSALLDRALRRHLIGHRRRTRFEIPFAPGAERACDWLAEDGFHPNPALYARWAEALAEHIDVDLSMVPESRATRPSGFHSLFNVSTR